MGCFRSLEFICSLLVDTIFLRKGKMQLSVHRVGFASFLVFVFLTTMAKAGMPSADELQKHLESAAQVKS